MGGMEIAAVCGVIVWTTLFLMSMLVCYTLGIAQFFKDHVCNDPTGFAMYARSTELQEMCSAVARMDPLLKLCF
jgi:hypothetical protein